MKRNPELPLTGGAVRPSLLPRPSPERDFVEWVERNTDRIWQLLRQRNERDLTFNQLARQLWSSV